MQKARKIASSFQGAKKTSTILQAGSGQSGRGRAFEQLVASVASAERVAVRSTGPNNGDGALGRDPDAGEWMDVGSVPDAFATDDSPEQDAVIDAMKNIYTFPDGAASSMRTSPPAPASCRT